MRVVWQSLKIPTKNRMQVILTRAEEEIWLSKTVSLEAKMNLLVTYPEELMKRVKVSKRVNAVSTLKRPDNDSDLLLPLNTMMMPKVLITY